MIISAITQRRSLSIYHLHLIYDIVNFTSYAESFFKEILVSHFLHLLLLYADSLVYQTLQLSVAHTTTVTKVKASDVLSLVCLECFTLLSPSFSAYVSTIGMIASQGNASTPQGLRPPMHGTPLWTRYTSESHLFMSLVCLSRLHYTAAGTTRAGFVRRSTLLGI